MDEARKSKPFNSRGWRRALMPKRAASATTVGRRATSVALAAAAGIALLAGCSNLRTLPGWRRAVVIHAPARAEDAAKARALLEADGWNVDVVGQGPARRARSSLAVYDAKKFPKMSEHLKDVLAPVGTAKDGDGRGDAAIEVLPFFQPGPGGASAVLWLAEPQ